MMKQSVFLATFALACSAAFAQAPASPASPAAKDAMPPAGAGMQPGGAMGAGGHSMAQGGMGGAHMGMDMKAMKAMDANSDGMISKKEFDGHHQAMWKKMKSKNGMVSIADMEAMMQGGRH